MDNCENFNILTNLLEQMLWYQWIHCVIKIRDICMENVWKSDIYSFICFYGLLIEPLSQFIEAI